MTAEELIKKLAQLPPKTKIVIRGYEDGYNDILEIIPRSVIAHPEQQADYYGEYTDAEMGQEQNAQAAAELRGENTKSEEFSNRLPTERKS